MDIKEVGNRGVLFTFDFGGAVYLINADDRIFLCDTNMGPLSMEHVKQYIKAQRLEGKEILIFNSHSDYDHIWGNCAFENSIIIGHEYCRRRMKERGEYDLRKNSKRQEGKVEIKLPNLTFNKKLTFEEDEIDFIYAPGHTICSSVCFDRSDSVLFVGDLIEFPIPQIIYHDLQLYLKSLEFIRDCPAAIIVTGHSGIVDKELVVDNIKYVKNLLLNNPISFEDEDVQRIHNFNIKNLLMLRYEEIARERLGNRFDYEAFKREIWQLMNVNYNDLGNEFWHLINISYEDLEKVLRRYTESLQPI